MQEAPGAPAQAAASERLAAAASAERDPLAPPLASDGPVVTAVRQRLAALPEPVHEHVAVYEDVHRLLQEALTRLDEG